MTTTNLKHRGLKFFSLFFVFILSIAISCSPDADVLVDELGLPSETDDEVEQDSGTPDEQSGGDTTGGDQTGGDETGRDETGGGDSQSGNDACSDAANFVFNEEDGLVVVEFEDADFPEDWALKSDVDGFSGEGYMVWEGSQSLGNPGRGTTNFQIKIENPGTYQFIWKSAVTIGDDGTEHNDTWLRFSDADDFYGQKGDGKVYPVGTDKTPNPEGASKDGWFKIYRSGSDVSFKWQSSTSDHNAHDIFVDFDSAGTYTMEISARSSGHGIDKFALFNEDVTKADATSDNAIFSEITCAN